MRICLWWGVLYAQNLPSKTNLDVWFQVANYPAFCVHCVIKALLK